MTFDAVLLSNQNYLHSFRPNEAVSKLPNNNYLRYFIGNEIKKNCFNVLLRGYVYVYITVSEQLNKVYLNEPYIPCVQYSSTPGEAHVVLSVPTSRLKQSINRSTD